MKIISKSLIIATTLAISAQANPLYTKCVACHGAAGEKAALNKSLIIKEMSKADFISAMKGYKDGSYGKDQKALMKAQVAALNDTQIEEIASFITKK
ncbi:c-type cytochrome [Sulfurospirillum multivorans]|uniref:Cytochrome c-553 n=2 Tax=Sulfurospirillum multivorans TaxID=66821 RepID=A0AA86AMK3_SULMK|nr:c-type cytochrome [Sulfurospirillum multivorans]AHJ12223.1 cytochrome c-553 [Sulfurospirillum multivorans DSM 12446]QEH05722.1 cytochrome c-553 [Sulfurospirillum multivorans]